MVTRDSSYGDRIIWRGRPREFVTPPLLRAVARLCFGLAFVSASFALVLALGIAVSPIGPLLLLAAWSVVLGLAALHGPRLWLAKVEYLVTDNHVIWKRGPFRRSIGPSLHQLRAHHLEPHQPRRWRSRTRAGRHHRSSAA